MKVSAVLAVLLVIINSVLGGCGSSNNEAADIGKWSIDVEVVGQNPVKFTNEDAEKIGPVEIKAAMKDGDSLLEEGAWEGILLNDFLKYLGVDKYSVISVEGANGTSQELDPSRVSAQGTGLGWKVNGQMLDAEKGPVQLINHNRGPKWWIAKVSKITVIK